MGAAASERRWVFLPEGLHLVHCVDCLTHHLRVRGEMLWGISVAIKTTRSVCLRKMYHLYLCGSCLIKNQFGRIGLALKFACIRILGLTLVAL